MTDGERLAWAAGLFEGEGSITTGTSRGNVYPRLTMTTTDEDVLRRFAEIVGGTVRGPYETKYGTKVRWQWTCTTTKGVRELCERFRPFLGARRRVQLERVIALTNYYGPPRKPGRKSRQRASDPV